MCRGRLAGLSHLCKYLSIKEEIKCNGDDVVDAKLNQVQKDFFFLL